MKVYHGKNNRGRKRDYGGRKYGNPLFRKQANSKRGGKERLVVVRRVSLATAVGVAVVLLGWYLLWSPTFTIESYEVTGATSETERAIRDILEAQSEERRALVFPQSSIFLYDIGAAREAVESDFYLNRLDIRKRLPRTVTVEVEEKPVVATLLAGGDFLALDDSGFVVRRLTDREGFAMKDLPDGYGAVDAGALGAESVDLSEIEGNDGEVDLRSNQNPSPLILDREGEDSRYDPGESAVSPDTLSLVLQSYVRLPDVAGSGIRWFSLDVSADTVDVTLRDGWHVFLTTVIPFDKQADRLTLLLQEKIGEDRPRLEYVDLRYDERIFFRYKDEPEEEP